MREREEYLMWRGYDDEECRLLKLHRIMLFQQTIYFHLFLRASQQFIFLVYRRLRGDRKDTEQDERRRRGRRRRTTSSIRSVL